MDHSLFLAGTKPKLISHQFSFTEGPAVDQEGNIFFTDQPNDQIWKYDIGGKLTLFTEHSGRSNGLYFDTKGNIVSCADEKGQLISFRPDATKQMVLEGLTGPRLNGPNDLWIDAKGGIYFTDPYYERDYWKDPKPVKHEEDVYYFLPGSDQPIVVESDVVKPNGIVGSPDGKTLFIADIGDNKTYKYNIETDGSLTNKKLFAPMGSDGMVLDEMGNLYITGDGVTIFDNTGNRVSHIPIDEGWTGNLCFCGKDRKTLFITASKGIYTMPMLVKGDE
ncbi:MAG: SMP-30/gluconolactonase/LRE family protein [Ginsengibacter sp.]